MGEYDSDLELAIRAARAAGAAVMELFGANTDVHYKSPDQPVTEADLRADRVLREMLLEHRSTYGWLSEETADAPERLSRERVWIVDPIDGTRSFVNGYREFSLSIGLAHLGVPVVGVVYNPATDELYSAQTGCGAELNGEPIRVSRRRASDTGTGSIFVSRSELGRGEFDSFRSEWTLQPLGSTAYKMAKVADGSGDVFLSRGPKSEWDLCAATLLVQEAGGRVTDLHGSEFRFNKADPHTHGVLTTNGETHAVLIRRLADLPPIQRER